MKAIRLAALWLIATASVALAQEANFTNAKVKVTSAKAGLEKAFAAIVKESDGATWIGYSVPMVEGKHLICCGEYSRAENGKKSGVRRPCQLEGRDEGMNFHTSSEDEDTPATERLVILYRVADKEVGKIRVFTEGCPLDVGGLTVHWLEDVEPKESLAKLAAFVPKQNADDKKDRRRSDPALAAIALHRHAEADQWLERLVGSAYPEETRKNSAFWMANVRGQAGFEAVRRLIREDASVSLREHLTFCLSICKAPEALNVLIQTGQSDKSSQVRGQALFWLSQKAGDKAAQAIKNAVLDDPETEVKKKAVFALSQLPKDEGVPNLIQVARINRNPTVRKEAMFWLGQSNDPRALAFFEEVLTK